MQPMLIQFHTMDVKQMTAFHDGKFDVVIDKSCLDAVACEPKKKQAVDLMISEIYRVLVP